MKNVCWNIQRRLWGKYRYNMYGTVLHHVEFKIEVEQRMSNKIRMYSSSVISKLKQELS